MQPNAKIRGNETPKYQQIIDEYGEDVLDLILVVYINFYYSELEIMELCSRWVERREGFTEKSYLIIQAHDEVIHAKLFKEGVERLGLDWDSIDHNKYRIRDIGERFDKLHISNNQMEVLIGLNMYAEGVLALEEIHQLSVTKPDIFYEFGRIYNDEQTHLRFGVVVAKRMIEESEENRRMAQEHCNWYEDHLKKYLNGELSDKIQRAIAAGFVTEDYIPSTKRRFIKVMSELGLETTI